MKPEILARRVKENQETIDLYWQLQKSFDLCEDEWTLEKLIAIESSLGMQTLNEGEQKCQNSTS